MHWLTALFLIALAAALATRLWLASRQIAAVQAHRDHVPEQFRGEIALPDQQKAADYTVARVRLGRVASVIDAVVLLALTLGGGIALLDAAWTRVGLSQPWLGTLVVLSVFAVTGIVSLPLRIWRTFRLEARFGFNRMTPALFVADLVKQAILGLAIGVPVLVATFLLMEHAGPWWWLYAWVGWMALSVGLTWAFPRFIAPLFNKFTPLEDATLRQRVEALLQRCGFTSKGLFVMDGSRRSSHGNAYFTGVGRNKRIVFFDTLIERLGASEVEAVLAHELGHFRLRHIRQRLLFAAATAFVGLALLDWFVRQPDLLAALGVPEPSLHGALLLFVLVGPIFTYFLTPIESWWSRHHEFQADDFASKHSDPAALADALVKLYRDNASTLTPDRIYSAFYDSHPPAPVRIARLKRQTVPLQQHA